MRGNSSRNAERFSQWMVARYLSSSPAFASAYPPVHSAPSGTRRSARRLRAVRIFGDTASCTPTPPQTNRMSTGPTCSSDTVGASCRPLLAGVGCPWRLTIDQSYTDSPVSLFAIRSGSTAVDSAIIEYRGRVRNANLLRGSGTCQILRPSCLIATGDKGHPGPAATAGARAGPPGSLAARGRASNTWMRIRNAHYSCAYLTARLYRAQLPG